MAIIKLRQGRSVTGKSPVWRTAHGLNVAESHEKEITTDTYVHKDESLARCRKWYGYLDEQIVTIIPDTALLDTAVELSVAIKHALKDCLYLAAAKQLGAKLVTAERTFAERARPIYRQVELLAGCEVN